MLSFIEMKTEGYCGGAGAGQQVAVWESLCFVYLEHKRQQASKARSGRAAGRASVVYRLRYYDWERKRVKQLLRMGHQSPHTYFTYFTTSPSYRLLLLRRLLDTLAHPHLLSLRSTLSARTMLGLHGLHGRCCIPTWGAALPWPDPSLRNAAWME